MNYRDTSPLQGSPHQEHGHACRFCGSTFPSFNILKAHSNFHHPQQAHALAQAQTGLTILPKDPFTNQRHRRTERSRQYAKEHYNNNQTQSYPPNISTTTIPTQPKKVGGWRQDWVFHNGPIDTRVPANLIFCGISEPGSLTGSCGFWIHSDNLVIACGATVVHQNFSSILNLEYEGLLNGLQAAIRRGVTQLFITCPSELMLNHMTDLKGTFFPFLSTIEHSIRPIKVAIDKALTIVGNYAFRLHPRDTVNPTERTAKKALADYHSNRYTLAMSKQASYRQSSSIDACESADSFVYEMPLRSLTNSAVTTPTITDHSHTNTAHSNGADVHYNELMHTANSNNNSGLSGAGGESGEANIYTNASANTYNTSNTMPQYDTNYRPAQSNMFDVETYLHNILEAI